jgi:hypothetical protein
MGSICRQPARTFEERARLELGDQVVVRPVLSKKKKLG